MQRMTYEPVDVPEAGDIAQHKEASWLDSRVVEKVKGQSVWIIIGESVAGPLPIGNYSYKRPVEVAEDGTSGH